MSTATEARAARRRRIVRIRRTVIAISLAMFIALFSGLYVQMASGRDPVLGSQTVTTSSATASSGSSSATSSDSTATSRDDSATSTNAVTTSQS
jgi:hypothetical protein